MAEAQELIQLRRTQPGDLPFLFNLYCDIRGPEVSAWGWDVAQREAFLRMQFEAQRRSYQAAYPEAIHDIVCCGGADIGRRLVAHTNEAKHIVDIALLSTHRNRGIGTGLIREVMDDCAAAGTILSLQVQRGNPAQRLYRKMGFRETDADPMYIQMAWRPGADPGV
jgi:ribosomal protein S18 acetylase RimI-like enzyme